MLAPQHLGSCVSGSPAADDYDRTNVGLRPYSWLRRYVVLTADKNLVSVFFDAKASDGIERRGS
jgi:hypothetical protein